jgi:hypothetical protein
MNIPFYLIQDTVIGLGVVVIIIALLYIVITRKEE